MYDNKKRWSDITIIHVGVDDALNNKKNKKE
jgi:hypothetical protein